MTRVYVFCEGQTEETFVREVLGPHFQHMNIYLIPILIRTGPKGKGGVSSYGKIKRQVDRMCKQDSTAWVTTMLDFYGLPTDFPKMTSTGDSLARAKSVERAFQEDLARRNFISNIVVHEFEGLLFSDPTAFAEWFEDDRVVNVLTDVRNSFASPEYINDDQSTAPSKRIQAVCGNYSKVFHGSLIALDIGLDIIRNECPLFDAWLKRLEDLRLRDDT